MRTFDDLMIKVLARSQTCLSFARREETVYGSLALIFRSSAIVAPPLRADCFA